MRRHAWTFARWAAILVGIGGLLVLALIAFVAQEAWARLAWDSHTLLTNADRLHRLGGTYYTAGADHKGPLWSAFYDLALVVASRRDAWFAIGGMIVLVAAATGAAVTALLRGARVATWAAAAIGIGAAIHLCFGPEEWSRTLYSRNIVILMSTAAFALVLGSTRAHGRRRLLLLALAGAILGWAVQTNLASAPTAIVGLAAVALLVSARPGRLGPTRAVLAACVVYGLAFGVAFLSAIPWYAIRGALDDFWAQWWTYNVLYSQSPGLSYGTTALDVIADSLQDFLDYGGSQPLLALIVVSFVACYAITIRRLDSWDRRLGFLLIAWLAAEMAAIALSQRFFEHYLVLTFIPVTVMAGSLLGRIGETVLRRTDAARLPTVAGGVAAGLIIVFVLAADWDRVVDGSRVALAFQSLEDTARDHVERLPAEDRRLREIVAANSGPGDFVYAWTIRAHVYDHIERSAASRYALRSWLTGRVFGGGASRDYILPGTWERWADDMRTTMPRLVVTFADDPVPAWAPLRRLLACGYEVVYSGDGRTVFRSTSALEGCLAASDLAEPTPLAIDELVVKRVSGPLPRVSAPVVADEHAVDVEATHDACLMVTPIDVDPYLALRVPDGRGLQVTAEGGDAQVFLDDGSGYSEDESLWVWLDQHPLRISMRPGAEPEGSSIRIDPPDGQETTICEVEP